MHVSREHEEVRMSEKVSKFLNLDPQCRRVSMVLARR